VKGGVETSGVDWSSRGEEAGTERRGMELIISEEYFMFLFTFHSYIKIHYLCCF
jgi:hypothetical protein